ncbi:DUF2927 domain-containing protein [Actibacterium sp. 188UL27-1]|uniref:DUF2927 domain-containing protein n=1 Tax=Actibacterium sp. 188UL27-1 TaxID=2786961 RepID=UPI00195E0F1E|nr:DUF2927 domain-containing protein [Actibacterium sp. 188UL27-1]MBM7068647.1 DUF2927 domain-containing protein [Actibacterium sp. 188UL27-1]
MLRHIYATLMAGALSASAASAETLPEGYSSNKLALQFALHFILPFPTDLEPSDEKGTTLRKWDQAPRVTVIDLDYLSEQALEQVRSVSKTAIAEIFALTNRQIDYLEPTETDADVIVVPVGPKTSQPDALRAALEFFETNGPVAASIIQAAAQIEQRPGRCTTFFLSDQHGNRNGHHRAVILIDAEAHLNDDPALHACLIEELGHVIGLIQDVPLDAPGSLELGSNFETLFEIELINGAAQRISLSEADIAILTVLGRDEFKNGMPLQEAIDLATEIFMTWSPQ